MPQHDNGPRTVPLLFVLKSLRVPRREFRHDLQDRLQVEMLEHERGERAIDVLPHPAAELSNLVVGEEVDHSRESFVRHRDEPEPIGVHIPFHKPSEGLVCQKTDGDSLPLRAFAELPVDRVIDPKCARLGLPALHSPSPAEGRRGLERFKNVCL